MRFLSTVLAALLLLIASAAAVSAETRVALVVGNSAYQHTTALANPLNDARDMVEALKGVGFDVVEALDADKRKLDGALRTFTDKLTKADVALFFYAGHGLQVGLQNYLVPIDARLERERDLEFEAVKLEFVLRQMEIDREGKTSIVFLDACRDNPLARNLARTMGTRSTAIGRGLAAAATGLGTFIAYATQPGNVALDGDGRNSPFTAALVRQMAVEGRNLPATMIEVRKDVVTTTGGRQVPWDHSALTGDFYFRRSTGAATAASAAPAAPPAAGPELAALQERLRRLEEDARKREQPAAKPEASAAASPGASSIPPVVPKRRTPSEPLGFDTEENVRIDGLKLSEQRQPNPAACRESCEREQGCVAYQHGRRVPVMGLCQLYGRVDARHEDPTWRSGVRAGVGATTQPSGTRADARLLPARIPATLSRKEQGFDVYEGVAIVGEQIKMSATDTSAGCRVVCRNTPGCIAATYNQFFQGKNVACQVYREVRDTMKMPTATTMILGE